MASIGFAMLVFVPGGCKIRGHGWAGGGDWEYTRDGLDSFQICRPSESRVGCWCARMVRVPLMPSHQAHVLALASASHVRGSDFMGITIFFRFSPRGCFSLAGEKPPKFLVLARPKYPISFSSCQKTAILVLEKTIIGTTRVVFEACLRPRQFVCAPESRAPLACEAFCTFRGPGIVPPRSKVW